MQIKMSKNASYFVSIFLAMLCLSTKGLSALEDPIRGDISSPPPQSISGCNVTSAIDSYQCNAYQTSFDNIQRIGETIKDLTSRIHEREYFSYMFFKLEQTKIDIPPDSIYIQVACPPATSVECCKFCLEDALSYKLFQSCPIARGARVSVQECQIHYEFYKFYW